MRTSHIKLITLEGQYYRKSHQTKKITILFSVTHLDNNLRTKSQRQVILRHGTIHKAL